jgi:peptidyl-prolyl cis-trans isomerase D
MKFSSSDLIAEVKLEDGAAQRYYEANAVRFERPARLRAEYVVFDEEAVLKKVSVSDEEAQKFYDGNPDRFGQPEERRARHILITVAADAPDDEVAKAREQAAEILAQLRSEPGRFEELAKARSQDPGSAEQGGDLGFFARGAMVKSFEDAVFTQEKGEVSELVRSDFGFHIIEVTDIKPSSVRPFAEVKEDVLDELRRQAAGRLFAEHAEQFANTVYEQADSLQPVADALGLEIRQTDWITRDDATIGSFRNEKLINALFSDEAIKQRRNVEAVEVERGTLVAARVLEFEPAQRLPFDEVRSAVEDQLRREEAARLAVARGEAALASLNRGDEATGEWNAALRVQRGNPTLPPAAMEAVFGASAAKLPTHVGIASEDDGYSVFRIDAVTRPVLTNDDPRLKSVAEQYERLIAERDFNAFLAALREHYKVEINTAALRAPQQ